MRYSSVLVVALILFGIHIPSTAFATLSVLADIDDNTGNGPDTLYIDPGDTLSIDFWITGTDSVHAFGFTVGDTAGALRSLPESAAQTYTLPGAWTPVDPTLSADSSRITLQATDFGLSTPLHAPVKVAEVDFIIAPGKSCGTLIFDMDMSGWYNGDLGEDDFSGFEGVTICVNGFLGGGGGGGGESAGGGSPQGPNDSGGGVGGSGGGAESGGGSAEHPRLFFWASDLGQFIPKTTIPPGDTIAVEALKQANWHLGHLEVTPPASLDTLWGKSRVNFTDPIASLGMGYLLNKYSPVGDTASADTFATAVHDYIMTWLDTIPGGWEGTSDHCARCFTVANFVKAYDWTEEAGKFSPTDKVLFFDRLLIEVDKIIHRGNYDNATLHWAAGLASLGLSTSEVPDSALEEWESYADTFFANYASDDKGYGSDGFWSAGLGYGGRDWARFTAEYLVAAENHPEEVVSPLLNDFYQNVRHYWLEMIVPTNGEEYQGFPMGDDFIANHAMHFWVDSSETPLPAPHATDLSAWAFLLEDDYLLTLAWRQLVNAYYDRPPKYWIPTRPYTVWAHRPGITPSPNVEILYHLPRYHYFPDQEVVTAKSGWNPTDVFFYMRCGVVGGSRAHANDLWYGGYDGHMDGDANGFLIYAHGDWQASEEGKLGGNGTFKRSETNNTILIDGVGQYGDKEQWYPPDFPDTLGDLHLHNHLNADSTLFYVAGNATAAYNWTKEPHVYDRHMSRVHRHVLYIRPDYFFIVDDLRSSQTHNYSWILNPGVREEIDSLSKSSFTIAKSTAGADYTRTGEMDVWVIDPDTSEYSVKIDTHRVSQSPGMIFWDFLELESTTSQELQYFTFLQARPINDPSLVPHESGSASHTKVTFTGLDWSVQVNKLFNDSLVTTSDLTSDGKIVAWHGNADTTNQFFAASMESLTIGDYGFRATSTPPLSYWQRISIYMKNRDGIVRTSSPETTIKIEHPDLWVLLVDDVPLPVDTLNHIGVCVLDSGTHAVSILNKAIGTGVESGHGGGPASQLRIQTANPNPFVAYTDISYQIPQKYQLPASLSVYNIGGRLVRDWTLDESEGVVRWAGRTEEGARASTAVYFVVLRSGGESVKRKLVKIR